MKKNFFFILLLLAFMSSYAIAIPDFDLDGVPDENDICPMSDTFIVDPKGCSCPQLDCASDNNPCTDDCYNDRGIARCGQLNNNLPCDDGICENGQCKKLEDLNERLLLGADSFSTPSGDFRVLGSPNNLYHNSGVQKVIVIVVNIGQTVAQIDIASLRERIFGQGYWSVNDYYKKVSYGKISLEGEVVGPYTLNSEACTRDAILTETIRAADLFVDFTQYSRIIIVVPLTSCLSNMAYGTLGKWHHTTSDGPIYASVSWIPATSRLSSTDVIAHELGHNFGLHHANSKACNICPSEEYGDPWDLMGYARMMGYAHRGHLNAPHLEEAGWLSNFVEGQRGQKYILNPLEVPGNINMITLPISDKDYYTLEFRRPILYDDFMDSESTSGIFMHLIQDPVSNTGYTHLINYYSPLKYPLLRVGTSFIDPANNYEIKFETISINPLGAFVSIEPYSQTNQTNQTSCNGCTYEQQCYPIGAQGCVNEIMYSCSAIETIISIGTCPPISSNQGSAPDDWFLQDNKSIANCLGCSLEGKCYKDGQEFCNEDKNTIYKCKDGNLEAKDQCKKSDCNGCTYDGVCYPIGTKGCIGGVLYRCNGIENIGEIGICCDGCTYEGYCYAIGTEGCIDNVLHKCEEQETIIKIGKC